MKKIIITAIVLFALLLTAVSCGGSKKEETGEPKEISTELIDENDPVEVADSGEYSRKGGDGVTYEGSYRIPRIKHETLNGAEELNVKIKELFDEKYAALFADGCKEELFVNVDYSFKCEHDVLSILITAEKKTGPEAAPVYSYDAFYYDALCDFEIDRDTYLAYLGHSTAEIFNALAKDNGGINEKDFAFALLRSSEQNNEGKQIDTFDVYISGDHGDKKYEVSVEKQQPDLSGVDVNDIVTMG